jgi:hypothetical protein
VEQYDLNDVDDEETPYDALRTMTIGDMRPQEVNKDQLSSNEVAPPTQANDQDQKDGQEKDDDKDQDVGNDQWRVEQDEDEDDQEKSRSSLPPCPIVRQTVQRDHPVNILSDIRKGVTNRSRVAIFCEHYLFVSFFERFKVKDALRDLDWVVVM